MKKIYPVLTGAAVVFLMATNFILVHRIREAETEIQWRDSLIRTGTGSGPIETKYILNSFTCMLSYSGVPVADLELTGVDRKKCASNDLLRQGPVLILRYAETNCADCVVFALRKLREAAKKYSVSPVIMTEYSDFGSFHHAALNLNEGHFPFYNVKASTEENPTLAPYCFVLMPDRTMQAVFIPDKMYPQITDLYLEKVMKRFFE